MSNARNLANLLNSSGVLTADGGVKADNITIDGTEIDLSSGDLTLDSGGDIILDADGGNIIFKDGGTSFGEVKTNSTPDHFIFTSLIQDKDYFFQGNDGGSIITALQLDMSDAGTAIFNHDVKLSDNSKAIFGAGGDLEIYHTGAQSFISDQGSGSLIVLADRLDINNAANTENMIVATENEAVKLYYDNAKKFETTSTGVYVTGAINIGGTGTANALDDYEEGTWTPVVSGLTLSSSTGHYVKIGKVVHFGLRVTLPSTSATTHFKVTGIPFSPHSTNNFGGALNFGLNVDNVTVIVTTGNDVQFYKTGASFVTYADYSGGTIVASGAYLVA